MLFIFQIKVAFETVTFVRFFYTKTLRSHNTQLHPSITDVIFELKSRSLAQYGQEVGDARDSVL